MVNEKYDTTEPASFDSLDFFQVVAFSVHTLTSAHEPATSGTNPSLGHVCKGGDASSVELETEAAFLNGSPYF